MQTHLSCFNSKNDLSYTVRKVNFTNSLNKEETAVGLSNNNSLSYTELVVILLPGYQTIFFVGKLQE